MKKDNYFLPKDLDGMYVNNEKLNYTGKYNPEFFWKDMGKHYLEKFCDTNGKIMPDRFRLNMECFVTRLKEIKPTNVLEVGCGFGRCLTFVRENVESVKKLVGIEHSDTMIESSKDFLKHYHKTGGIDIVKANAKDIPFENNSFDLVYSHVCLSHIPPEDIPRVTSEISRIATKWIIHIERFAYPYEHSNPHRWSHLLAPYYLDMGWRVHECDIVNKKHKTNILVLRRVN